MSAEVTLTAALRSNLLSLQGTQRLLDQTQLRLATGLKVNSALDNPGSYFAAQALNNRAGDLSRLLDGMGQAVQVLKSADQGIKSATSLLEQAQAVAQNVKDTLAADSAADVTALETSYNTIVQQLKELIEDSGYRGTNLLAGGAALTVTFNEATTPSSLTITGFDFSTTGAGTTATTQLAVSDVGTGGFSSVTAVDTALAAVKQDLTSLRNAAANLGSNLNIINTRLDFTQNLINTLKEGADKLTVADKNEEGAKLLSLQTTQQLGITSLSLASQANQAILRLFQ
jgi:flagellin